MSLLGVKRYQHLDTQQLIDVFTEQGGYEYLARGRMSYVFKAPDKDEVLKVWVSDTAYEKFVLDARAGWHRNKHIPRFYTPIKELTLFHKRTSIMPRTLKWLRMERLHVADMFTFDGHEYPVELLTEELSSCFSFDEDNLIADIETFLKETRWTTGKTAGPELQFFVQTAMTLLRDMDMYGAQPDLHYKNLMKRADGTAVIIDPGGFGEELTMAGVIKDLEAKHTFDAVGSMHETRQTAYTIVSGPVQQTTYYVVADSFC